MHPLQLIRFGHSSNSSKIAGPVWRQICYVDYVSCLWCGDDEAGSDVNAHVAGGDYRSVGARNEYEVAGLELVRSGHLCPRVELFLRGAGQPYSRGLECLLDQ